MALTDKQIYSGLVYRKTVYDFIYSDAFKECFDNLKRMTKSAIIDKLHLNKHTKSFENCKTEFEFIDKLEDSLGFDAKEWTNNVAMFREFFNTIVQDPEGSFKTLTGNFRRFLKSLRENGLLDETIVVPTITLDINPILVEKSSVLYSPDNSTTDGKSGATNSDVPREKYHSSAAGTDQASIGALRISSKPLDPDKCYPINPTGKRGICLLVNIFRKHSFLDVPPARQIFEGFNYEFRVFDNVTAQEYIESLQKVREEIEQLKSDSFIMIISSHGDENNVIFFDGKMIDRSDLVKEFSGDYCPSLIGKPKLFFFQNCRISEGNNEDISKFEPYMTDAAIPNPDYGKPSTISQSDILRIYATADGTVAYRDESGSVFLQTLYEILRDPVMKRLPINDIEINLRRMVHEKTGNQLPESTTSMMKTFYFCHP